MCAEYILYILLIDRSLFPQSNIYIVHMESTLKDHGSEVVSYNSILVGRVKEQSVFISVK